MRRANHRAFVKLRRTFRAACALDDVPCWLCGLRIAYDVPDNTTEDSFNLDHYFPVSTHPELEFDPAGFRASHAGCNKARGNRAPTPGLARTSRSWI